MRHLFGTVRELVVEYFNQALGGLAAQAAFRVTIALPSLLLVLMTVAGLVDRQTGVAIAEDIEQTINNRAPDDLVPLLDRLLDQAVQDSSEQALSVRLLVALLIAWWGASGSVAVVLFGCNQVYRVQDRRHWIERRIMVLVMTILGALVIVATSALFVFGNWLAAWLASELFENRDLSGTIEWYGRGLQAGLLVLGLLVLYRVGPDVEARWRWLIPGTLVAAAGWNLALVSFTWVLTWSNPGSAYGAAGSVIALLLLIYWLALIVLIGALVNAVLGRRLDPVLIGHLKARVTPTEDGKPAI